MNQWLAVLLLAVALLGVLGALYVVGKRHPMPAEVSRKITHIALGFVTLSFPWLFRDPWPPAVLAGAAIAVMVGMRRVAWLHDRFGSLVNGVGRESLGDLYFPVAAVSLFLLSRGSAVLFAIPILTLTLADAVAATIGLRYGRLRFATADGTKSMEGSIAFFMVAFLATHIPLLLFTRTPRIDSLLIGATFGVLVMLLEAVAWRGLDNLFIPIGGYLVLSSSLGLDTASLAENLVVAVVLLAVVLGARRSHTLNDSALLAGVLIGYVSWSVGGWRWLVPPLVVFLSYAVFFPRPEQIAARPHDLVAIFAVTSAGLLWLALRFILPDNIAYYAYTLSFAANLCFIGVTWFAVARPGVNRGVAIIAAGLIAWGALFVPFLFIRGSAVSSVADAITALFIVLFSGAAYTAIVRPGTRLEYRYVWEQQAMVALAASIMAALVAKPLALQ